MRAPLIFPVLQSHLDFAESAFCSIHTECPPRRLPGRSWKTWRVIGGTLQMRSASMRGTSQSFSEFICLLSFVSLLILVSSSSTASSQCRSLADQ